MDATDRDNDTTPKYIRKEKPYQADSDGRYLTLVQLDNPRFTLRAPPTGIERGGKYWCKG